MRHKIAYALHCRLSIVEAENLGWGVAFERAYNRVCACIAFRLSSNWQETKWLELGGKIEAFNAWMARNRAKLGYIPNTGQSPV